MKLLNITNLVPQCLSALTTSKKAAFTLAEVFSQHSASRRKTAFTLAEVLITLGIIGIVATMTMPTLTMNFNKRAYTTSLHKVYNEIMQATEQVKTDNRADTLTEAGLTSDSAMHDWVKNYFKVAGETTTKTSYFASSYKKINISSFTGFANRTKYYVLANGVSIAPLYSVQRSKIMNIAVDTNGKKGPNTLGRDLFFLAVYDNGLVDDFDESEGATSNAPLSVGDRNGGTCFSSTDAGSGWGCFGRIMNDGWEMKY